MPKMRSTAALWPKATTVRPKRMEGRPRGAPARRRSRMCCANPSLQANQPRIGGDGALQGVGAAEHGGTTYSFCSTNCRDR
jgi:hypothetical protein